MIAFRRLTPLALLGTAALVAACSTKKDATADSTSTSASATTTSSTVATTPSPAADSAAAAASAPVDPAHFTDANILAKEIAGDSSEVQVATLAKSMATSAAVKSYASLLVADHSRGLKEAQSVATKAAITPAAPAGDTTAQATDHVITRLKGLAKGAAFDSAFVNHEVEDHQQDIQDAQAMSGAAKDAKVKALVEKSLPELKKHLAAAQKLAGAKS